MIQINLCVTRDQLIFILVISITNMVIGNAYLIVYDVKSGTHALSGEAHLVTYLFSHLTDLSLSPTIAPEHLSTYPLLSFPTDSA